MGLFCSLLDTRHEISDFGTLVFDVAVMLSVVLQRKKSVMLNVGEGDCFVFRLSQTIRRLQTRSLNRSKKSFSSVLAFWVVLSL